MQIWFLTRCHYWYIFVLNMASLTAIKVLKSLEEKRLKFITEVEFVRLFKLENRNTVNKMLQRLNKNGILKRVIKGKYVLGNAAYDDFELANFLIQPSYISFESALSFYGILSQFTYTITSATIKRAKKIFFTKEFEYTHLDRDLFWGFIKNKNSLIATPEKAFLDTLYLSSKGLRKIDLDELDTTSLNKKVLNDYLRKMNKPYIKRFLIRKGF